MIVVDSSGWVEYLTDGPLAEQYAPFLSDPNEILVPSVVLYEVYKWARRERGEQVGMVAAAQLTRCHVLPLDQTTALTAADLSLEHRLAMADALVYATGRLRNAEVITSDRDFEGLPGARYLAAG